MAHIRPNAILACSALCLAAVACLPALAVARSACLVQTKPDQAPPVSVAASAAAVAVGVEGALVLTLDIQPGMHMYPPASVHQGGGMPAEFEFTLPDGVTLGQAQWPAPHEVTLFGEREQVYEGRIVVRIPFTATQAGALPVVGTLFAQACTDDSCHMVEQAFATTLQVNG